MHPSVRSPLWRMVIRRCGYRGFLLTLCSTYFTAMYMFQSGLESTRHGAKLQDDLNVDRAALRWAHVGADAFEKNPPEVDNLVAAAKKRNERRNLVAKFDAQQEFDGIRQDQRKIDEESEIQRKMKQFDDVSLKKAQAVAVALGDGAQHDSSVPPSCAATSFANPQFVEIAGDVYVYSAYWDARSNDFDNRKNGTLVRAMAIVRQRSRPVLWCRWPTGSSSGVTNETLTDIYYYELCENHNRPYGSFILYCHVPNHVTEVPCNVTLVAIDKSLVNLPMRTLKPPTGEEAKMNNFTVCVPPLFGSIASYKLVEFFELTFLLGADRVVIYDFNVSRQVRELLHYYSTTRCRSEASNGSRKCRVDVIPWQLPATMDSGIWYHGQSIAIQDCLYRNMAVSNYVLFNDVDEFVVPHGSGMFVWNDIVDRLWTGQSNRCALQFVSAFYNPNNNGAESAATDELLTMTALQRSREFSGIRTKCLVKPLEIFEAGIHHISKPIFGNLEVHRVDRDLAHLHHYRPCTNNLGMNCVGVVEDRTMLSYKNSLNQSVIDSFQLSLKSGKHLFADDFFLR